MTQGLGCLDVLTSNPSREEGCTNFSVIIAFSARINIRFCIHKLSSRKKLIFIAWANSPTTTSFAVTAYPRSNPIISVKSIDTPRLPIEPCPQLKSVSPKSFKGWLFQNKTEFNEAPVEAVCKFKTSSKEWQILKQDLKEKQALFKDILEQILRTIGSNFGGPLALGADVIIIDDPQMSALIPLIKKVRPGVKKFTIPTSTRSDLVGRPGSPQGQISWSMVVPVTARTDWLGFYHHDLQTSGKKPGM
ncbi:hypothetical protein HOY82DRAFT_616710 [Tuber indicum]|nr:hypothetical protein HOY82DRAFT_616710 [Tuber indicum]